MDLTARAADGGTVSLLSKAHPDAKDPYRSSLVEVVQVQGPGKGTRSLPARSGLARAGDHPAPSPLVTLCSIISLDDRNSYRALMRAELA